MARSRRLVPVASAPRADRSRSCPCRSTRRRTFDGFFAAVGSSITGWNVPRDEILELRRRRRQAQQRLFGCISTSGRRGRAQRLAAQNVEVLRRRGRIRHEHVVLRAQLQEALETRARVLRPLPFVAVRQQHHDARVLPPLRAVRRDELIDDALRDVREVAVLRLPQHERIRATRR